MATRQKAFKPSPRGLQDAAKLLHRAYKLILDAETKVLGYQAYSDVHGLASRTAHTMERVAKSAQMSALAKSK